MPDVAIRRVHIRDRASDALAARLRTERALALVELRPRGLAPGAILIVRSLRARVADAPEALEELLRSAARPALGAVPASAQAVLFASRAELLACLAEDSCRGVVLERWWWPLVSRAVRPTDVAAVWVADPEAVPAALSRLAERGRAVEFAAALTEERAAELATAVARVHGVDVVAARHLPMAITRNAWQAHAPVIAPEAQAETLTVGQASFVRIALTLARAPSLLRTRAAEDRPAAIAAGREPQIAAPSAHPTRAATTTPARRPEPSQASLPVMPSPSRPAVPERAVPPDAPPAAEVADSRVPAREASRRPTSRRASLEPAPPTPERERRAPTAPRPAPPARSPESWPAPAVATEIGGLFFLLTIAQRLGLYADFTEPLRPGIAADPWRFVEHAGKALLADPEEHADDPVWRVLDELACDDDDGIEELDEHVAAIRRFLADAEVDPLVALERPALVRLAELRVDVVFALATHPIELRLSGIDLDPGWIPAAGRALHFHFE